MMKLTEKCVEILAKYEDEMAAEEWGEKFASLHEGAAVLREEIEEALDDAHYMNLAFCGMWEAVKENDNGKVAEQLKKIYKEAILGASEMIRVAAMAMKMSKTL